MAPRTAGEMVEARAPAVVALAQKCGPILEQAVRKAAAQRDPCSPYQLGVRKEPETWTHVLYGAHLLGLHARMTAEIGTPRAALWMLIDGAASRGSPTWGRAGGPVLWHHHGMRGRHVPGIEQ